MYPPCGGPHEVIQVVASTAAALAHLLLLYKPGCNIYYHYSYRVRGVTCCSCTALSYSLLAFPDWLRVTDRPCQGLAAAVLLVSIAAAVDLALLPPDCAPLATERCGLRRRDGVTKGGGER